VPVEVHVVTPERELWSGEATTVIARGVDGEVGILAGHMPMLIQLAIGPLRILRDGEPTLVAVVDGGFMHVGTEEGNTRVDVMASYSEFTDEIDLAAAKARAEEMTSRIAELDTATAEAEIEAANAELKKALARIDLAS
jgi:F-type H+-transporting ATPase subunit epsilon